MQCAASWIVAMHLSINRILSHLGLFLWMQFTCRDLLMWILHIDCCAYAEVKKKKEKKQMRLLKGLVLLLLILQQLKTTTIVTISCLCVSSQGVRCGVWDVGSKWEIKDSSSNSCQISNIFQRYEFISSLHILIE